MNKLRRYIGISETGSVRKSLKMFLTPQELFMEVRLN